MSESQRAKAKPEMTVKDLRSMKQRDREEAIRNTPAPACMKNQVSQTSGHKQLTLEEIQKEDERLQEQYGIECHITKGNNITVQISHYVMQEICKLAGIKYIDYEDYKITIEMIDEDILGPGEKYIT